MYLSKSSEQTAGGHSLGGQKTKTLFQFQKPLGLIIPCNHMSKDGHDILASHVAISTSSMIAISTYVAISSNVAIALYVEHHMMTFYRVDIAT